MIDEKCIGCSRVKYQLLVDGGEELVCSVFSIPAAKWRLGDCNMATHLQKAVADKKKKVNPLKASKRSGK